MLLSLAAGRTFYIQPLSLYNLPSEQTDRGRYDSKAQGSKTKWRWRAGWECRGTGNTGEQGRNEAEKNESERSLELRGKENSKGNA